LRTVSKPALVPVTVTVIRLPRALAGIRSFDFVAPGIARPLAFHA